MKKAERREWHLDFIGLDVSHHLALDVSVRRVFPKSLNWVAFFVGMLGFIFISQAHAQTNISNNLTVLGSLNATNDIYLGTTIIGGTNVSALTLDYNNTNYAIDFIATQPGSSFFWQDNNISNAPQSRMLLDASNKLTLFDTNTTGYDTNGNVGMILNPNDGGGIAMYDYAYLTFSDGSQMWTANGGVATWNADGTLALPANGVLCGGWASPGTNGTVFGGGSAAGNYATAMGYFAYAYGDYSEAIGNQPQTGGGAYGAYSTAIGGYAIGEGYASTAVGYGAAAWNTNATALGEDGEAYGVNSLALGGGFVIMQVGTNEIFYGGSASGNQSTVFAGACDATGLNSTAMGFISLASGDDSTAFGIGTTAASFASIALGRYNVGVVTNAGSNSWVVSDPVLEVGNGTNTNATSDGFTISKGGEMRAQGLLQSKQGVRIPPMGDLSMDTYTNGASPATLNPATGLLYPNGS